LSSKDLSHKIHKSGTSGNIDTEFQSQSYELRFELVDTERPVTMYFTTTENRLPPPFKSIFSHVLIIVLLFFSVAVTPAAAQTCTDIPAEECQALGALYNQTGGDQWIEKSNWLATGPANDWYGITVEGGHVTEIDLSFNNLTGTFPRDLVHHFLYSLVNLKRLDLHFNNLTGTIPAELGNMTSLQTLNLAGNNLYGEIPPELGNLANLEELILFGNALIGNIPAEICQIIGLKSIAVSGNLLSGEITPELQNLTNLEGLGLSSNHFSGSIPSWIGNLTKLKRLGLSSNRLIGPIPPELGNLIELERLGLDENELTGPIPSEFGNLTKLRDLGLRTNNLNGSIPSELGNLTGLTGLDLSRNQLSGEIPPELGNLIWIMYLVLEFNNLTGPVPQELGDLSFIQNLNLNSNNLCGDLPSWLANPPSSYFWIDLRYNRLFASDNDVLASMEIWHDGKFLSTQTLPPKNVTAETVQDSGHTNNRVRVTWNPVNYVDDPGCSQVFYRQAGEEDFHYGGMTKDKETTEISVSSLEPGADYEFLVNTVTWNHGWNGNILYSEDSNTAAASAGTLHRAFIPVWKQSPEYFTGVVASNFGDTDFELSLTAWDADGHREPLGANPKITSIKASRQKSLVGVEFFNGDPSHTDFSWIELGVENSRKLGSIFLFGASDTRMLDGAEAQIGYSKKLYFTRPINEHFFEGWDPDIQLCIVNPTDEEVGIVCWMKGTSRKFGKSHAIPPRGFLKGTARELIPNYYDIVNGYMEIDVTDGPGVLGFSRIEFPAVRTALGINAVEAHQSEKMYSAQLAHGAGIVTNLQLVNTNSSLRNIKLTPIADDGSILAAPVWVAVHGEKSYNANLGSLFKLDPGSGIITGSLVVESFGKGVIGDIIFAEGETMEYAMSLPLQAELFTDAVFNHISNLATVFTGFAFFNPGEQTSEVTIEAIGINGETVAGKTITLNPGERIARILTDPDIWPDFPEQSGGYIKIRSSQPIAGQQLFGDRSLRYMAAIPPTIN